MFGTIFCECWNFSQKIMQENAWMLEVILALSCIAGFYNPSVILRFKYVNGRFHVWEKLYRIALKDQFCPMRSLGWICPALTLGCVNPFTTMLYFRCRTLWSVPIRRPEFLIFWHWRASCRYSLIRRCCECPRSTEASPTVLFGTDLTTNPPMCLRCHPHTVEVKTFWIETLSL